MSKEQILVIEDEEDILALVHYNLTKEGFRVATATSGEDGLAAARSQLPELILLDLMLPGIDGIAVCKRLRRLDPRLPVLMLTARGEERDRLRGLSAGADDYLTKPFSLDEFLLRVKGMLRRSEWYHRISPEEHYAFGTNQINLRAGSATTAEGDLRLTDLEARMLRTFFRREGEILSRADLLEAVWGMAPDTETRTLDNFIVRLRKYFEVDPARPRHFLTIRGRGYRFLRNPDTVDR